VAGGEAVERAQRGEPPRHRRGGPTREKGAGPGDPGPWGVGNDERRGRLEANYHGVPPCVSEAIPLIVLAYRLAPRPEASSEAPADAIRYESTILVAVPLSLRFAPASRPPMMSVWSALFEMMAVFAGATARWISHTFTSKKVL